PKRVRTRIPVESDGVACTGRKDFLPAAVRIEAIDSGAHFRLARRNVGGGTDTDIELFALTIEQERAGPVASAEILEAGDLLAAGGGHILLVVLVPLDGRRFADVEIFFPEG